MAAVPNKVQALAGRIDLARKYWIDKGGQHFLVDTELAGPHLMGGGTAVLFDAAQAEGVGIQHERV